MVADSGKYRKTVNIRSRPTFYTIRENIQHDVLLKICRNIIHYVVTQVLRPASFINFAAYQETAVNELNSVNDNLAVDPENPKYFHGGNFNV